MTAITALVTLEILMFFSWPGDCFHMVMNLSAPEKAVTELPPNIATFSAACEKPLARMSKLSCDMVSLST
jgi:hypothetical protein